MMASTNLAPKEDTGAVVNTSTPVVSPLKKRKHDLMHTDKQKKKSKNPLAGIDENAIVGGKRERRGGVTQQNVLDEWCLKHLVVKEGMKCNMATLYSHYLEECSKTSSPVASEHVFYRQLNKKFPSGFGVSEGSFLRDLIKETKVKEKKKKDAGAPKLRDSLIDTFKALGNPSSGIRFSYIQSALKQYYNHLKIATYPKMLLNMIKLGVASGWIECVRGVGRSGYYRIYLEDDEQAELDKLREAQQLANRNAKKAKQPQTASAAAAAASTTDGGTQVNGEAGSADVVVVQPAAAEAGAVKKGGGRVKREVKYKKRDISEINHRRPASIDDTFPLAITYMSDPKEATFHQIKRYILDVWTPHSRKDYDKKLEEALKQGCEWGWWTQQPNEERPIKQSSFRLEVDEFDPHRDGNLTDRIITAIVAVHEPKQCSVVQLRKYWRDFHPEYKTEVEPLRYKKALVRAAAKQIIRQVSGIGSAGSFQLVSRFHPDPYTLVGPGEEESEEESSDSAPNESASSGESEVESEDDEVEEKYIPRGTKSRGGPGGGRQKVAAASMSRSRARPATTQQRKKKGKGRRK